MRADKQTLTYRHADRNATHPYWGEVVNLREECVCDLTVLFGNKGREMKLLLRLYVIVEIVCRSGAWIAWEASAASTVVDICCLTLPA